MLSGLLGGSPFNGKLSARTQIWTSISTSPVTKRKKNLFQRTILQSLVLLPQPIPYLRRASLLLMSELPHSCLPDVGFTYSFTYVFPLGRAWGPCSLSETCSYIYTYIFIFHFIIYYLRSHCSIVAFLHDLYGPD